MGAMPTQPLGLIRVEATRRFRNARFQCRPSTTAVFGRSVWAPSPCRFLEKMEGSMPSTHIPNQPTVKGHPCHLHPEERNLRSPAIPDLSFEG